MAFKMTEEQKIKAQLITVRESIAQEKDYIEMDKAQVDYYEILIRELVVKYGDEGKEMFREMYPDFYRQMYGN